jgi:DNA-binding transcriptional LysR family regulator
MQIENLKLFCELVAAGSFTRVAKMNGITQSAISQMLHALEHGSGERLATRTTHSFKLTPAGETFHQHSLEIVRLWEKLDQQMHMASYISGAIVELAVCHSIGLHQLPPVLNRFSRDFPEVTINVCHGLIDWVHQEVAANHVDLGLVCYPRRLPGLAVDTFRHERLMLVCHPQHPLASRPAVTMQDLKGQKFVAWNEIHWSPFLRNVPGHQRHLFEPQHEFDHVEMVKRMVEIGAGIAFLPEALVLPEVANHVLAAVPFADGGHTEPLAVIYRRKKRLTPAMENFIRALKQPMSVAD